MTETPNRRQHIADLRAKAAAERARTDRLAAWILPVVSMLVLVIFAAIVSHALASVGVHMPVLYCWGILISLYWTIRLANT
jgi:hypothetical protein